MQRIRSLIVLLIGIVAAGDLSAQILHPRTTVDWKSGDSLAVGEIGKGIETFIAGCHEKLGFTGAVLTAVDGKIVAAIAVGPNLKTTTLFEIASTTKSFTGMALVKLQEEGKLSLDDSIAEHLPGVPENCREITVRDLLQHTSGFPGRTRGKGSEVAETYVKELLEGGPDHPPGSHWEYWNPGYALLSEIVARVSGQSYVDYCRDKIFKPAGMANSCFTGDTPPASVSVAVGTSVKGAPRSALDHPYGNQYGYKYRGMGGLATNLEDLWKWNCAIRDHAILSEKSTEEMVKPSLKNYALGWQVLGSEKQLRWFHGGSVRGFLCSFNHFPNSDRCLIVLANQDDKAVFGTVQAGCMKILFGTDPGNLSKAGADIEPALLSKIAGSYESNGRTFRIEAKGGKPDAKITWGGERFTPGSLGKNDDGGLLFYFRGKGEPLAIEYDEAGSATSCSLYKMKFSRVK